MLRYLSVIIIFTAAILFVSGKQSCAQTGIFSEDGSRVDLSEAMTFERYMATGESGHLKAMLERFDEYKVSDFFSDEIREIDEPAVLLMIGMMYCPDCKVVSPFMEAIARINPLVETRYIVRNDTPGAREFMKARTGRTNMPAIFALSPDGTVLDGAYVETPESVTRLLEAAEDDEAKDKIWDDFHGGVYDEEVQRDLIKLLERGDNPLNLGG